ncbi:MAG: DUF5372 family protein [Actinomycetota bacterium]|nr:DUF5372 family protein [Actinomycetota bacterium]
MRVTHPFHPLAGCDLEFVKRRKSWRQDRVYVFDAAGELVNLPAEWTDAVAPDGSLRRGLRRPGAVPPRRSRRADRVGSPLPTSGRSSCPQCTPATSPWRSSRRTRSRWPPTPRAVATTAGAALRAKAPPSSRDWSSAVAAESA